VLNIEAGTVIKGQTNATAATISALFITRGAKIYANGTANSPIIFTSVLDNTDDPFDLSLYQRGLWGGVVLLGNAKINTAGNAEGNAANPKFDVYEGLSANQVHGEFVHRFGGNNDDDNSGVFRYVSIRHGGKVLESSKEINGLSMGGVGRGTTIEFVETYAIADDGFEFFGGTVNTKYLVSAFNDDDAFDADEGYNGKNQFWLSIQEPGARDKGFELNGEPDGIGVNAAHKAKFTVYNATAIGAGTNSGGANNNTFNIKGYASPSIYNSIFTEYAQRGIAIDATSFTNFTLGDADLRNNLWWGFTGGSNPNSMTNICTTTNAQILFTDLSRSNSIVNPLLRGIGRLDNGMLDPRPQTGSPALTGGLTPPNDGFYAQTSHRGAFNTVNWAADWTALAEYRILNGAGGGVPTATVNVPAIVAPTLSFVTSGGSITLECASQIGRTYQLQSADSLGTLPGWNNIGAPVAGTGANINFVQPIGATNAFYQIMVQ